MEKKSKKEHGHEREESKGSKPDDGKEQKDKIENGKEREEEKGSKPDDGEEHKGKKEHGEEREEEKGTKRKAKGPNDGGPADKVRGLNK